METKTTQTTEILLLQRREELHQLALECYSCQEEIEPHWQTCAYCDVRLDTRCPGCGNPLPPAGAQACPHCGLAIPTVQHSEAKTPTALSQPSEGKDA